MKRFIILLALLITTISSAGAAPFIASDIQSPTLVRHVDTLSDVQAIVPAASIPSVYMEERGGGVFKWDGSDLSTEVTGDSQQCIYIAPTSAPTGASGAWVRQYDGNYVDVRWCGFTGGTVDDNLASINAALAHSPDIIIPPGTHRVSTLPDFSSAGSLRAAGVTLQVDDGQHSVATFGPDDPDGLIIRGKTIESITLNSVTSVTGTPGAWSVTGVVSDGTKVDIGDIIRIKDVLPGIINPGSIPAGRPVRGEMRLGFFQMGELSVTGTTATISGTGVNTYLLASDILLIKGQVVRIASITNDTTFVISRALAADVTGLQYWYYLDNIAAGTATTSGTTVTLSGSYFGTYLNAGGFIAIADAGIRRVVSVDSDTQCTVDAPFPTVSGKVWGVLDLWEMHEGAWVVTNVSGNNVTWTNTNNYDALPTKNFNSANINVYKTQLQFSGDAISPGRGKVELQDVTIYGNGTGTGLDLQNAGTDGRTGQIVANTNVSVVNFAYGAWCNIGGQIFGQELQVTGSHTRGVNCTEGGQFWGQKSTVSGNTGVGVFVGPGSYARLSDARVMGNTSQGIRLEVGASMWLDFGYVEGSGSYGILAAGGANVHAVGTRAFVNGSTGLYGQNGLYGRASGLVAMGNASTGITIATGQLEANQANCHGNNSYGLSVVGGFVKFNESGSGGNVAGGILANESSRINIKSTNISDEAIGVNSQDASEIRGANVGLNGNTSDVVSTQGGRVNLENATSGFTTNITKNTFSTSFGYIADGTSGPP